MTETPLHFALVGNPNCGKTALFNRLTGARAKVANYAGVTVEKRSGALLGLSHAQLIDLPGTYSLHVGSRCLQSQAGPALGHGTKSVGATDGFGAQYGR